ncbi:NAD(P)H-dependent flavin oxidoreductase [Gracilibacillus kekensis]|uniref:Probable nitronate monooxygenase n=1 Tax=Gracilibacillus kekensis TaxID=1027249 RepID=A0A1M7LFK1_9BACI|nr:nitronate monooxygenase [Gracilibacillus kekensis]SHM76914.1 nitronate monooxygenase [Gracilibacillus kekensis]
MINNTVTKVLQIRHPIIQAPMAGGVTTSELVAEVSNCGGLGMIGAGYMTPGQMEEQIREIKKLTQNFFGVNLFVPTEFKVNDNEIKTANQLLNPIRAKLNVQDDNKEIPASKKMVETFHQQVKVILEEKVPVCSFTFGIPSSEVINELKQNGTVVIGTATTVNEAVEIEKCGMDMVVVQGSEAGGHRGNFLEGHQESQIGLFSLVPQVVDNVGIPVIAAGGIMDGRGLQAAICLGAKAVQMGTAFLTCMESGASELHKDEILHTPEDQTVFTRSFSGKWARGIKNRFISELENREESLPNFPVQNKLTKEIRKAATQQNNREYMSIWSGQSPRLAKKQTVKSLIESIVK